MFTVPVMGTFKVIVYHNSLCFVVFERNPCVECLTIETTNCYIFFNFILFYRQPVSGPYFVDAAFSARFTSTGQSKYMLFYVNFHHCTKFRCIRISAAFVCFKNRCRLFKKNSESKFIFNTNLGCKSVLLTSGTIANLSYSF